TRTVLAVLLVDVVEVERRQLVQALEHRILVGQHELEPRAKRCGIDEVADADAEPRDLVREARSDAAAGGADSSGAAHLLVGEVDDAALAFIAPLAADDNYRWHN